MTRLAQEVDEEWANEKRKKRSNTIRWFKETQARKVAKNGTFPCWFHGMITRRFVYLDMRDDCCLALLPYTDLQTIDTGLDLKLFWFFFFFLGKRRIC